MKLLKLMGVLVALMLPIAATATPAPQVHVLKYTNRKPKPLIEKLNPIWWFGNDDEQRVTQAPWYHPEWPLWERELFWNLRNPLQNFRAYVIGVQDRNYSVRVIHGDPDPNVVQRDDIGQRGLQQDELIFKDGLRLPFVSYSGRLVTWYLGWQPSGFFGAKFNVH